MERRGFLKRLLGTAAVAVIAPDILAQIEEYQYVVEGKPRQGKLQGKRYSHIVPDDTFIEGRGFWAIHEGEMIVRSYAEGVALNMLARPINTPISSELPWETYRPGPMEVEFEINHLQIVNEVKFQEIWNAGTAMDIVATMNMTPGTGKEETITTFSGQGILTSINVSGMVSESALTSSATFIISGELIQTTAKDD